MLKLFGLGREVESESTWSLDSLLNFDGGELFRSHILPIVVKEEWMDVSELVTLRTVSKAWRNQFYMVSTIFLAASVSPNRNSPAFYDELIPRFPNATELILMENSRLQPNLPFPFFSHEIFRRVKTLSVIACTSNLTSLIVFLPTLTQLTDLALPSLCFPRDVFRESPLCDAHLAPLVNLQSLRLYGPYPRVTGRCFRLLVALRNLILVTMPSIKPKHFLFLRNRLEKFSCNSAEFLKSIKYTGRCIFLDDEGKDTVYEGDYVNGVMHGRGIYYSSSGHYVGEMADGTYAGYGTYYFNYGGRYEGQWVDGCREGWGIDYREGGTCTGEWVADNQEGYAVDVDEIGRYEGNWKNGARDGFGIYYRLREGKYDMIYEGQWKDSQREGFGVNYWDSGNRYEGEWKLDKMDGEGSLYKDDVCDIHAGTWQDDKLLSARYKSEDRDIVAVMIVVLLILILGRQFYSIIINYLY